MRLRVKKHITGVEKMEQKVGCKHDWLNSKDVLTFDAQKVCMIFYSYLFFSLGGIKLLWNGATVAWSTESLWPNQTLALPQSPWLSVSVRDVTQNCFHAACYSEFSSCWTGWDSVHHRVCIFWFMAGNFWGDVMCFWLVYNMSF